LARFPSNFDESGNARAEPSELDGEAGRKHVNPILIATFLVLLVLCGIVAWLVLGGDKAANNTSTVTLRLQPPPGAAEDLMQEAEKQKPAPPVPAVRRVLPATRTAEGRLVLSPAPDPMLIEQGQNGPLPKIAADGAQAWHVYAHPFPPTDARPRIAILISGLGMSKETSEQAIQRLPDAVSLALAPDGVELQNLSAVARAAGHEILLELPMEPYDYPENDPGPHALLTTLSAEENTVRLEWLLSRFAGYIGVINFQGGKFVTSETALGPVMAELKGRGLMIVDDQAAKQNRVADLAGRIEIPVATANVRIDDVADAAQIDARLAELEQLARENGYAAGVGISYPITIERVIKWAATLEAKGIALAPISALVQIKSQ